MGSWLGRLCVRFLPVLSSSFSSILFHSPCGLSSLLPQNRSLETVPACVVLHYYPYKNTVYIHMCDGCKISSDSGLSQALVHFVIDRASLFTDHKISGRPILAKYKHFRTIWELLFDKSPTDFNSSSMKWWSSMHGVDTFVELLNSLVCQPTLSFHISWHDLPYRNDQGKMLVLPNQLLCWLPSTSDWCFGFFPANFYVIHIHR